MPRRNEKHIAYLATDTQSLIEQLPFWNNYLDYVKRKLKKVNGTDYSRLDFSVFHYELYGFESTLTMAYSLRNNSELQTALSKEVEAIKDLLKRYDDCEERETQLKDALWSQLASHDKEIKRLLSEGIKRIAA